MLYHLSEATQRYNKELLFTMVVNYKSTAERKSKGLAKMTNKYRFVVVVVVVVMVILASGQDVSPVEVDSENQLLVLVVAQRQLDDAAAALLTDIADSTIGDDVGGRSLQEKNKRDEARPADRKDRRNRKKKKRAEAEKKPSSNRRRKKAARAKKARKRKKESAKETTPTNEKETSTFGKKETRRKKRARRKKRKKRRKKRKSKQPSTTRNQDSSRRRRRRRKRRPSKVGTRSKRGRMKNIAPTGGVAGEGGGANGAGGTSYCRPERVPKHPSGQIPALRKNPDAVCKVSTCEYHTVKRRRRRRCFRPYTTRDSSSPTL